MSLDLQASSLQVLTYQLLTQELPFARTGYKLQSAPDGLFLALLLLIEVQHLLQAPFIPAAVA